MVTIVNGTYSCNSQGHLGFIEESVIPQTHSPGLWDGTSPTRISIQGQLLHVHGCQGLTIFELVCFCLYLHQNIGCPWVCHWDDPIRMKGISHGVIIADWSYCIKRQRDDYIEWSAICVTTSHHRAFWDGISRPECQPHVAACRVNHHMFTGWCFHSLSGCVHSSGHSIIINRSQFTSARTA